MNPYDSFLQSMDDGMKGRNEGLPMGFSRLNRHIGLRRAMIYLLGGYTGSGKTSLVDDAFVLNPYDWLKKNKSDKKLKIVYWSMERKKEFKIAKWIGRRIFLDTGIIIPVERILGWVIKDQRLTKDEHDLVTSYGDYFREMFETCVTLLDGRENPTGFRNYFYKMKEGKLIGGIMQHYGKLEETGPFNKVFIPNDPNLLLLQVQDHLGKAKGERGLETQKQIIDKISDDNSYGRDLFGISTIEVSQFNRDISNPTRIKQGDVEPRLEDFKDSGDSQEDADVVLSLFDPTRYKVDDPAGYELDKLRDLEGRKVYRFLKILKNSYGSDDIGLGLAFQPEIGTFKEMPKLVNGELHDNVYQAIINNQFFLYDGEGPKRSGRLGSAA